MKTKLNPEEFLEKNHCHSAKHLKNVFSPDMIEGNHYERLLLAMEDYGNERIKEYIENKLSPEEFIKDRYDWSSDDLERWKESMKKLPMANFDNVIHLMESYLR